MARPQPQTRELRPELSSTPTGHALDAHGECIAGLLEVVEADVGEIVEALEPGGHTRIESAEIPRLDAKLRRVGVFGLHLPLVFRDRQLQELGRTEGASVTDEQTQAIAERVPNRRSGERRPKRFLPTLVGDPIAAAQTEDFGSCTECHHEIAVEQVHLIFDIGTSCSDRRDILARQFNCGRLGKWCLVAAKLGLFERSTEADGDVVEGPLTRAGRRTV